MKRHIGDREICRHCGFDIEWWGRAHGWIDRGNNRDCPPYYMRSGEVIIPKGKHKP